MSTTLDFIADPLVYALGWAVVHSLWQAMLIALLLAGSMILAQRRSARFRYGLAVSALLLLLMVSGGTFYSYYSGVENSATAQIDAVFPSGDSPQIVLFGELEGDAASKTTGWFLQLQDYFEQHLPLIVAIWLLGVAFFLLRMLAGLGYVQHLRHRSVRPLEAPWQEKLHALARQLKLKRPVRLLESAVVNAPVVIGWLRPVILIPVGTVVALTPAQVEAVIAHELAHIYRRDYLLNIFQSIIEALYYFNPAVWWISAYVRMERENCCDDIAVALSDDALAYAKALVKIEEASKSHPRMAMAMASKGRPMLLQRIRRILNQPQQKMYTMEKMTATGLLLAALLFFSFSYAHTGEEPVVLNAEEIVLTSEVPVTTASADPVPVSLPVPPLDTIPKGKIQIQTDENGKTVDVKLEDGEIKKLNINGKEIPESDFKDHEAFVESLLAEMPTPPAPPAPPTPPSPPVPPSAPKPPKVKAPKAPKAPKAYFFDQNGEKTIRTEKRKDGSVIIEIEDERNGAPIALIVEEEGGEQVIRIDDAVIQIGDSLILEGEDRNVFYFNDEDFNFNWEDDGSRGESFRNIEDFEIIMENANEATRKAFEEIQESYNFDDFEIKIDGNEFAFPQGNFKVLSSPDFPQGMGDNFINLYSGGGAGDLKGAIEREMMRDGFIKSPADYKFLINGKGKLKINGKRMQEGVYKRYKALYESQTGSTLSPGDVVEIIR
ncbi:MAG: M56 family metallopeptidase [Phaeodactylibacter sp.]|nr:M56 family metallopeptidase [Phaeodactylibacter sp.]